MSSTETVFVFATLLLLLQAAISAAAADNATSIVQEWHSPISKKPMRNCAELKEFEILFTIVAVQERW
jgi:predicted ABC-class ATPase